MGHGKASILTLCAACLVGRAATAQFPELPPNVYINVSEDARKRLDAVDSYLRDEQWVEAAEALQDLVERYPDRLVPLGGESPEHFLSVRTVCHQRISRLPQAALRVYRQRVDGAAEDLLRRAESAQGDQQRRLFQRLVDEFFCSSVGDHAIEKLGDHAMSGGDFVKATYLWSQLLSEELLEDERIGLGPPLFRFPDPVVDDARLTAKIAVAEIFRERVSVAAGLARWLRETFPDAAGELAGREGPYAETVHRLVHAAESLAPGPASPDYRTFAGAPDRTHVAPKSVDVGLVQWQWEFEQKPENAQRRGQAGFLSAFSDESLNYFPVVTGNQAHLATGRHIWTFDLETGRADSWYDFEDDGLQGGRGEGAAAQTLTVDRGRLFVRAGSNPQLPQLGQFHRRRAGRGVSKLYCFDYQNQRLLWVKDSGELGDQQFNFEGAPAVKGENVFVALTRTDATVETNVACLDRATGQLRWRAFVCESTNEANRDQPSSHNLLTLAGDTIFYSTNLGAVAALGADRGDLKWVARYRRRDAFGRRGASSTHPTPSVYHDGKLFVAASDTEKLQCFDSETGRKLWDASARVEHVLGVAKGNLIVTGDRVWGFEIETGKRRWYWPENDVAGYGRGVLAGDFVYWPTINEIHVLDQGSGRVARPSIGLHDRLHTKGGNMVLGDGFLLLTQAQRLVALFPYTRLIDKLQQQLVERPHSAELHMRLAQAAFSNDDFSLAATHFELGAEHAQPEQVVDGEPLQALAKTLRFEALLQIATTREADQDYEQAEAAYENAADAAPDPESLAEARKRQSHLWLAASNPEKATRTLQHMLVDPQLTDVMMTASDSQRVPVRKWAAGQIDQIIKREGRQVYEAAEAEAAKRFSQASGPDALAELAETFPNSRLQPRILLAAGRGYLDGSRFRDARQIYKKILYRDSQRTFPDESQFEALLGLQLAYQQAGLAEPELIALDRLSRDFAGRPIPAELPTGANVETAGDWVRYRRPRVLELSAGDAPATVAIKRRWRTSDKGERVWLPEGRPPSRMFEGAVRTNGARLAFCSLADGATLWERGLDDPLRWTSYSAVGLLVATARSVGCLSFDSGDVAWEWKPADGSGEWRPAESVGGLNDAGDQGNGSPFHLVGDTLLYLDEDRLTALDVDRGKPIWESLASSGPQEFLGSGGSVVCIRDGNQVHAVNLYDGGRELTIPLKNASRASVAIVDDRIFITTGRDSLAAYDLRSASRLWEKEFRPPIFSWISLYANSEALLAIHDGNLLMRIDPDDGEIVSKTPLTIRPSAWEVEQAAFDGDRIVYASNGWLEARRVSDGGLEWRTALPGAETAAIPRLVGSSVLLVGKQADDVYVLAVRANNGTPSQLLRFPRAEGEPNLQLAAGHGVMKVGNAAWVLDMRSASNRIETGGTND